jgi:predicted nucleic acid-binding protein
MWVVLDSGILLRTVHTADPLHPLVAAAVQELRNKGFEFFCAIQNVAEFWNVTTRPATARGGFGQSLAVAEQRLLALERWVTVLPETPASYAQWRRLIVQHGVSGVQVHDARLVALIRVEQIDALLTLNARDFTRYAGFTVLTPAQVVQPGSPP